MADSSVGFVGSVPEMYERYLGPMFLAPYAVDMAGRLAVRTGDILEIACGTGILTRELLAVLDPSARVTATDLNDPMLAAAQARVSDPRVRWQQADAMALPFEAQAFDAVVSQFGVMFFPDKAVAARQVARVLRPGGTYLFNVWGTHGENPVAQTAQRVIEACFPENTPAFYHVPWGYADRDRITADLHSGGFRDVRIEAVDLPSRAASAEVAALGLVQGNPMVMAIRERGSVSVEDVTRRMADALTREFGAGPIETTMRALVVSAAVK